VKLISCCPRLHSPYCSRPALAPRSDDCEWPHEGLVPRGLQEMVIDPVIAGRHKIPITRGERGMISLVEKIEFQFACAEAGESLFFKQLKLSPQHRTRRLLDEGTILSDEITNHQCCARLPGKSANCLQIRTEREIPKTASQLATLKPSSGSISIFTVSK